jgi:hypothetical protein
MSDEALAGSTVTRKFPLTEFIVALARMTPEQRQAASAERASSRYGLPLPWCEWWIKHFRSVFETRRR